MKKNLKRLALRGYGSYNACRMWQQRWRKKQGW